MPAKILTLCKSERYDAISLANHDLESNKGARSNLNFKGSTIESTEWGCKVLTVPDNSLEVFFLFLMAHAFMNQRVR